MRNCDVALIQEPWTYKGAIKGLKEVGGELIYSRSIQNPRTCILIKKGFQILPLTHHCSRDLTAMKIKRVVEGRGRSLLDRPIFYTTTLNLHLPGSWKGWSQLAGLKELTLSTAVMQTRITAPGIVRTSITEVSPCLITLWLTDWT